MKIAIHKVPENDFVFRKSASGHNATFGRISLRVLWQELEELSF